MDSAWYVDGHRIVVERGLLGEMRMSIDGVRHEDFRVKLSRPDYAFQLGPRPVVIKTFSRGRVVELWSGGVLIPPETVPRVLVSAPDGAVCSTHPDSPAAIACVVCGTFLCGRCRAADGMRCTTCFTKVAAVVEKERALAPYGLPAVLFFVGGGPGVLLGLLSGSLTIAIVRSLKTERARVIAAGLVYGAAAIVFLVTTILHRGGR